MALDEKKIIKEIENNQLSYRKGNYIINTIPVQATTFPNTIYIYQKSENEYVVASTDPRSYIVGEKNYTILDEAESDFYNRLAADKKAAMLAEKAGRDYPPLPF